MPVAAELVATVNGLEIKRLECAPFGTNAYLLLCSNQAKALLIDAPGETAAIVELANNYIVQGIIITHGHADHTLALNDLKENLRAPVAVHEADSGMLPLEPELKLKDGDILNCGSHTIKVIHTPGHTAGSICLQVGSSLLAGDTIFPGGPGKTATPEDFKTICRSIQKKIISLPDNTLILPGHGASTTVGRERKLIEAFRARVWNDGLYGDVTWG